jgi:hypothetical protein
MGSSNLLDVFDVINAFIVYLKIHLSKKITTAFVVEIAKKPMKQ